MRIVTLNTWKNDGDYMRRLELMAASLRDLRADAICLQECFTGGAADTAGHLACKLSMHATQQPARAKLRMHEGGPILSTSGLAVLSRDRPTGADWLALTADARDGERIALRVDLACGLRILNLHLTHLRDAAALRSVQLAEALAWARSGRSGPTMACGDLNCAQDDPEFAALRAAAGEDPGPTLHAHRDRNGGRAIDHGVLVDPGGLSVRRRFLALQDADARGRFPSDHAAVVIDLDS